MRYVLKIGVYASHNGRQSLTACVKPQFEENGSWLFSCFRAMGGSVPFEDALAARLALFRPSVTTVAKYLDTRPPK